MTTQPRPPTAAKRQVDTKEQASAPKTFFIETWGCQMNQLDSQRMGGQLLQKGMQATSDPESADVILLNSCSVREKASHKAYSRIGQYRLLKEARPELRIGFCGCVAQQEGEQALERIRELDFVVGTGRVGELGRIIDHSRESGERIVATGFPVDRHYDIDAIARDGSHKGMITIVEGCNKRCTFCIVPTTRGPEQSRPMGAILQEAKRLVEAGFAEIELLGQTVNHWRDPEPGSDLNFADLLDAAARIEDLKRLRFVTSYPRDFTPRMVEQFARHSNLCSYLHLPVQSGSDRVLRRMGRGYTVEEYRILIDRLRGARPDIALSTDLIVGFPGETEADFERTLKLVEQIRFASVFAFKYSPRPGTAALRLADEIDPSVADDRLQRLFRTQGPIQEELNQELVGRSLEVLITGPSRQRGFVAARTSCHRIVHFATESTEQSQVGEDGRTPHELGTLRTVRITRAHAHSLLGEA